jgi:hypothetical protein
MTAADAIACTLAAIAVALGVAAVRERRARLAVEQDWTLADMERREQDERWRVETDAAHAAELDALQIRYERERDLADGRLRMLVAEREEHAAATLAVQQEVETLRQSQRNAHTLAEDRLDDIERLRDEVETLRRQLHEAVEEARHLRVERDEARSRVRWVRRQDPPPGADARLLRVVCGGQAALLTEERLAEGHRRAEIVAGAWEDER